VSGLAAEGDLVALHAKGSEDDTEREVERLEHRPLLDVQLEVGGRVLELLPGFERSVELDADATKKAAADDSDLDSIRERPDYPA